MKKILFVFRSTPYRSTKAQEGVDAALSASVFDYKITILFMDEGIWQLHNHQQSHGIKLENLHEKVERKNIAAQLDSFPLYDINEIYADEKALKRFSIPKKELILNPLLASDKKIRSLMASNDIILTY
jgi:tRNA 2-thiouridine synthesizing protein C